MVVPLADVKFLRSQQTSQWFSNPVFSKIGLQQDADEEMNKTAARAIATGETDGRDEGAEWVAMETG